MHRQISIRGQQRRVNRARSSSQIKRARSFKICCNFWSKMQRPQDRERWKLFAIGNETGFNAFLRINIIRVFNGLPCTAYPPT